jgi:hypothetical protein
MKRIIYLAAVVLMVSACKTAKTTAGISIPNISSKKIVKNHYKADFYKKTINASIKLRYDDGDLVQSISIKMRMEKDSAIWMSGRFLGLTMAKIYITPNSVQFYEKMGKQYFKGDFKLLSNFLGTEVDFDIIQNLLLGQALSNLEDRDLDAEIVDDSYKLVPEDQAKLFDILFWVNPENFKMNKQEIRQTKLQKKIAVNYVDYQTISNVVFPKKINVIAVDKSDRVLLDLEYRSVVFDQRVSFPFSIPSGYDQIKINE